MRNSEFIVGGRHSLDKFNQSIGNFSGQQSQGNQNRGGMPQGGGPEMYMQQFNRNAQGKKISSKDPGMNEQTTEQVNDYLWNRRPYHNKYVCKKCLAINMAMDNVRMWRCGKCSLPHEKCILFSLNRKSQV
jgi:hypothetical protein